jgi:MFS family permease
MHEVAAPAPYAAAKKITVTICAASAAFLAYSSVYAFRKPFSVATFDGVKFWGITYQTLLIISQVIGYMLSKFCGIKFIAELNHLGRFRTALTLVAVSWVCLLIFAIVPAPFGMIFLFVNGFMLGFLWGLIFSYVEGRRATDFIGSVMAVSFIFAGGFTRSVAKWLLLKWAVTEYWMPFMTGLLFILPLIFFLWVLESLPDPDEQDVKERTKREPMSKGDRKHFLKSFGVGLAMVTITYTLLTVMRDIRDNYMGNIWTELGYGSDFSIFTKTETNTSLIVLAIMGLLVLIRKNINALLLVHIVIAAGLFTAGASSFMFIRHTINGVQWMQLVSLGLYMGYIPFNCIFFERLIASFRIKGNVGFLIYFADAFGYLGSVVVMLGKEFLPLHLNWSQFYSHGVAAVALIGIAGTCYSFVYFYKKYSWWDHGILKSSPE